MPLFYDRLVMSSKFMFNLGAETSINILLLLLLLFWIKLFWCWVCWGVLSKNEFFLSLISSLSPLLFCYSCDCCYLWKLVVDNWLIKEFLGKTFDLREMLATLSALSLSFSLKSTSFFLSSLSKESCSSVFWLMRVSRSMFQRERSVSS